jgi:hypothetical protein
MATARQAKTRADSRRAERWKVKGWNTFWIHPDILYMRGAGGRPVPRRRARGWWLCFRLAKPWSIVEGSIGFRGCKGLQPSRLTTAIEVLIGNAGGHGCDRGAVSRHAAAGERPSLNMGCARHIWKAPVPRSRVTRCELCLRPTRRSGPTVEPSCIAQSSNLPTFHSSGHFRSSGAIPVFCLQGETRSLKRFSA